MFEKTLETLQIPIMDMLSDFNRNELLSLHVMIANKGVIPISKDEPNMSKAFKEFDVDITGVGLSKDVLIEEILELSKNYPPSNCLKSLYLRDNESANYLTNRIVEIVNGMLVKKDIEAMKFNGERNFVEEYLRKVCDKKTNVLNVMKIALLLGRFDRKIFEDGFDDVLAFRCDFLDAIFYNYSAYVTKKIKYYENTINSLEKKNNTLNEEAITKNTKINSLKNEIKEVNNRIKSLESNINELKRNPANPELVQKLYDDLQRKDMQVQKLMNDINSAKEKPVKTYDTLIMNLNNQIIELKKTNQIQKDTLKESKAELQRYQDKNYIKNYIIEYLNSNSLDEEIYNAICLARSKYEEDNLKEVNIPEIKSEIKQSFYKIGYCVIEDNVHYVVLPNDKKIELLGLPDKFYLANGQFICIDSDGNYKWHSNYRVEFPALERNVDYYGCAMIEDGVAKIDRGYRNYVRINRLPHGVNLREKQIISVDEENNFIRYYKSIRVTADAFIDSMKAREFSMCFVLKVFPVGYYVRDVESGNETLMSFDPYEDEVKEKQIIIHNGNKIINIINTYRFYTNSSFYTKLSYGTVEYRDDLVFVHKTSGEVVIVNEVPPTLILNDGDVIGVDEFNNYVLIKESHALINYTRKKYDTRSDDKKSEKINLPDDALEVTVIGNKGIAPSYIYVLAQSGFRCSVVDGYDTWYNINREIKDADYVVIITENISHLNMDKVKLAIQSSKLIFSQYEGANRVADELLKVVKK